MRVRLPVLIASLAALASPALAQSEVQAPRDARYVFVGVTRSDAGVMAATYVAAPEKATEHGQARVWVIDVFQSPLKTPKGVGAYSTADETIDCDHAAVKTTRGGLFDANGQMIDSFTSDGGFAITAPGSMGYATGVIVCKSNFGDVSSVSGLAAALVDGKTRPSQ
ncbi:MAG TPA: surface-adhesin E family protein [Caulobacteraceae bacterium]|jgi:hypothetical protein|nr:surface-adhesin E family protein [Caulobacteraceae bacterium]